MAKKFTLEAIFAAKDRLSPTVKRIRSGLGELGAAAGKTAQKLDKVFDKGLAKLGGLTSSLGIAGAVSFASIGYAMTDVMQIGAELEKTLVRTGNAFEKPVRRGTKEFAELAAAARNVGMTTEFSTQQGAEALNSLATAGYSLEQSVAALPGIIDFASASTLELGQASDITSDTLGAFNLRTSDAAKNAANMARVMDALTRAAADSTTNVTELFEGIRAGGAFASTAGASLEQYVALQGVLANKGFKGAEAGTAIRNSFLHLTKQTKEASEAMARLGVKVAKTRDGSIDMMGTIGRFTKATAKLTREKKAEAIATIFGAYTVGPFLALMDAGEPTIRKFASGIEGATGVTREMAGAMRESASAQIARFFNILESVKLTVFDAIAPTVLGIAESIGKWATANRELIATKAGEWAATLRDNLPEIATGAERVAKAIAGFYALAAVVKIIAGIATVAGWLSTAFAWVEFTALLLGTTVGALVWPVLAIGAAIAAVVALAWHYWPEISGFFSAIGEWAVAKITAAWEWIKGAFDSIKPYLVGAFEFVVGLLRLMWAPGIAAVEAFASLIGAWMGVVVGAVKAIWTPLTEWWSTLWAGIVAVQTSYFDTVVGVWSGLIGFFSGVWTAIADTFSRIVAPIVDTATGIINTIRTVGRMTLGTADGEGGAATTVKPGERPQVVSPQARAAQATAEATAGESASVDGKITVEAKPGTKATVDTRANKVPIVLRPSGAFR